MFDDTEEPVEVALDLTEEEECAVARDLYELIRQDRRAQTREAIRSLFMEG